MLEWMVVSTIVLRKRMSSNHHKEFLEEGEPSVRCVSVGCTQMGELVKTGQEVRGRIYYSVYPH